MPVPTQAELSKQAKEAGSVSYASVVKSVSKEVFGTEEMPDLNTVSLAKAQQLLSRINEEIKRRELDVHQVIFYHDEFDFEANPKDVEELKEILLDSIISAGHCYRLRIPMKGDVKIGKNWKEIH